MQDLGGQDEFLVVQVSVAAFAAGEILVVDGLDADDEGLESVFHLESPDALERCWVQSGSSGGVYLGQEVNGPESRFALFHLAGGQVFIQVLQAFLCQELVNA